MMPTARVLVLFAWAFATAQSVSAQESVLGTEAVKLLPIADAHFHVMPFMALPDLVARMDRHGIRWAGGAGFAGMAPPGKRDEIAAALGKRFIVYTGQSEWIQLKRNNGVRALEEAGSPAFKQALARIERDLRDGGAHVLGEIHVNTVSSASNELLRHKVRADAPTLKAMFELAAKYHRPMNVHAQWDSDTAAELARLAESNRKGRLILAHCGSDATASDIRAFFETNPNVMCDLSFRSPAQLPGRSLARAAYDSSTLRADWKRLIEDYPERFMVGIDDVHGWSQYDDVARNIRDGLLANLSPATAEKVAYKNAVALFGLE